MTMVWENSMCFH